MQLLLWVTGAWLVAACLTAVLLCAVFRGARLGPPVRMRRHLAGDIPRPRARTKTAIRVS